MNGIMNIKEVIKIQEIPNNPVFEEEKEEEGKII